MRALAYGVLLGLSIQSLACATPAIEAYGKLPAVEQIRLSPSGARYAVVLTAGDQRELAVLSADDKILYRGGVGDTKVRSLHWAGENHVLLTVSSTYFGQLSLQQSYELASTVDIPLDGKKPALIFAKERHIAKATFGYYGSSQSDGHVYAYFAGLTYGATRGFDPSLDHGYPDLYRVDLDTQDATIVDQGNESSDRWLVGPDGTILSHSQYNQRYGLWQLFPGRDLGHKLMETTSPLGNTRLIGRGRTASTVLVIDNSGDEDHAEEVSLTDGSSERIWTDLNIDEKLFDPVSHLLIGATTWEDHRAVFFDPKLQARYNAASKAFPGRELRLYSYTSKLDSLIVETDGGDDSGSFWSIDMTTGKARPIGNAYPAIGRADVGPTQVFKYLAQDGLPIEGVLTLPPGRKPEGLPLVLLPHGGPIRVGDQLGFDWWAQAYASRGYAVLQPNYRGSAGYGRSFVTAAYGQLGRKMQTDLSDGVKALAAAGIVDPRRVAIVGGSYGGYAALAGVTLQQGLYRCAVSVSGLSDLASFSFWLSQRNGYEASAVSRFWLAVTGAVSGSDSGSDTVLKTLSPINFAKQADAPILLIHAADDTVVPIEQSEHMATALRSAGKSVEFLTLPKEDHWLSKAETRSQMLKAAVNFVLKNNPPD